MTYRCDCLPKSVSRKYFNFIKAEPVNARSKVAQFEQPIIAVKHVKHQDSDRVIDKRDYILCHVSFQSTGGTNISTVNALLLVVLYVRNHSKGRGQQKRTWGIEMNEAQEMLPAPWTSCLKDSHTNFHCYIGMGIAFFGEFTPLYAKNDAASNTN